MYRTTALCIATSLLTVPACKRLQERAAPGTAASPAPESTPSLVRESGPDATSYAKPSLHRTKHVALELELDFATRTIAGQVSLELSAPADAAAPLVLDTRDLTILGVEQSSGTAYTEALWKLGEPHAVLGAPLTIELSKGTTHVRVRYRTAPTATGLQWLSPEQTGTGSPFLFSQSQAIHARSWIPLQDTPAVRSTYSATVQVPANLLAVMSAANPTKKSKDGRYTFEMKQPIPSYLIALGVGDLVFGPVGKRTGVYAAPSVLPAARSEFEDMESMLAATEEIYGPYRWERFDVLVLPASFPFGGMENPRLTFATPTILAGDKSLVSLIAHELAHSWSGNLVTNATWRDLWMNEGFTVFVENRIQEVIFGKEQADMEAVLAQQSLEETLRTSKPDKQLLHATLETDDPDDMFSNVAYEKGAMFLGHLEHVVGRPRMDRFLKDYFAKYAFQSATTADFVRFLQADLLVSHPDLLSKVPVAEWLYEPGLPKTAPRRTSAALERTNTLAKKWIANEIRAADIKHKDWNTHEWLQFLRSLPDSLSEEALGSLAKDFGMDTVKNSEVLFQWLHISVANDYAPSFARLEQFLTSVGRIKFIRPLYAKLAETQKGLVFAKRVFKKAKSGYHPIAANMLERLLAEAKPEK